MTIAAPRLMPMFTKKSLDSVLTAQMIIGITLGSMTPSMEDWVDRIAMFESSFWDSGYPVGIAILIVCIIISKVWRGDRW